MYYKPIKFKPYKDIETAIYNWRNDYYLRTGEVKIKPHNNISKDERSLIDATILCKVLITFEANYVVFKRKYSIQHVGHLFWDHTTWQMKYKDSTSSFEIHSSKYGAPPDFIQRCFNSKCTRADIIHFANCIHNYINIVLRDLSHYAPQDRYNSIREHIHAICDCE